MNTPTTTQIKELAKDYNKIAEDVHREAMAVQIKDREVYGIQFHLESIRTPQGSILMRNFLNIEVKH